MVWQDQIRWRCITLHLCYNIEVPIISQILGCSQRSIWNWLRRFNSHGTVSGTEREKTSRYSQDVLDFINAFVQKDPTFLIEELKDAIQSMFPTLTNTSTSTILRALRHDLGLTRKIITKQAREARLSEVSAYHARLSTFYRYPEQLVFVDESSKDSRDTLRNRGWSKKGSKCIKLEPHGRGKRLSVLAAMDCSGFFAFDTVEDTFDRQRFHDALVTKVLPYMNQYPLPRSILILDNAKIHLYPEVYSTVESFGVLLVFLPPYCPMANPIEMGFGLMKRFLSKHCKMAWNINPWECLNIALGSCIPSYKDAFNHCGYHEDRLDFSHLMVYDDENEDE
jgi:transposase